MNHPYLASRLFNTPLMIHPGKLHAIVAGLSDRFGVMAPPHAYTTPTGTREKGGYRVLDSGVAVIDIFGVLAHLGGFQADSSYIQGYDGLARQLDAALSDPTVRAILLNIDSPGGEVAGAFQLADQIHAARSVKPIAAVAGDLAASAGYLIASAAETVSVTPTGMVGSIGVVTSHVDMSKAIAGMGMTVTYIYAGAHKVDGNPTQPLSPEVTADIQAGVDYYYQMFLQAVARYRPAMSAAALQATEARIYIGQLAVEAGLADRIETPDQAITRLAASISPSSGAPRARSQSMKLHNPFKKRLNLDISVSESPEDTAQEPSPDEQAADPPPAPIPTESAVAALTALEVVQLCNAAGEASLAELALKAPHTREQLQARLAQAKAVRAVCASARRPDLADGLIAHGATEADAMLATWEGLVARSNENPVDATPPSQKQVMRRADFDALDPRERREFALSGGIVTD